MKIRLEGFALIIILLGAAGIFPALYWHSAFAQTGNATTSSTNTTSTVTTSTNTTATTNSTSPPTTTPASTGTSGMPMPSGSSSLTVVTDKPSYNDGDKVTISGRSDAYLSDTPVTVIVRSPIGNVVKTDQIMLGTDQTFSANLTATGPLWQAAGTYTVYVQLGTPDRSATTTFAFTGAKLAPAGPSTIPVDGTNFSIQYTITNGKVLDIKADQPHTSLIVSIQTTGDGVLTITLPRALIDSKNSDGTDKSYVVSNDGQMAQFNETGTTSTDRTLVIPFKNGTQQISIMGTFVVPEFGPIAALVLTIAIVSIIAVSKKTGLRLIPKY